MIIIIIFSLLLSSLLYLKRLILNGWLELSNGLLELPLLLLLPLSFSLILNQTMPKHKTKVCNSHSIFSLHVAAINLPLFLTRQQRHKQLTDTRSRKHLNQRTTNEISSPFMSEKKASERI